MVIGMRNRKERRVVDQPEDGEEGVMTDPNLYRTMKYYNLQKNWTQKIEPHLSDELLVEILVHDFNKFTFGRWGDEFTADKFPRDFETCLWDAEHLGSGPRYRAYVKHSACHWLVNFSLRLASLAVPKKPWRIITSDCHSTVWDGHDTLFDFNFLALGVAPEDCFALAYGLEYPVGEFMKVYFAEHYSQELAPDHPLQISSFQE